MLSESPSIINITIAVIGFAGSVVMGALLGGWRSRDFVAKHEEKLAERIDALREEYHENMTQVIESRRIELEQIQSRVGESMTAIRTKIHEVEVWGRDTYVRAEEFRNAITGINAAVTVLRSDMNEGMRELRSSVSAATDRIIAKLGDHQG